MLQGIGAGRVRVHTPEVDRLAAALAPSAETVEQNGPAELLVGGLSAAEIGTLAHALGVPLHHLAEGEQSLEHAYLSLTEDDGDYRGRPSATATLEGA